MNLTTLHADIDEVTEEISPRNLAALVIEYSNWFSNKVRTRTGSTGSAKLKRAADNFADASCHGIDKDSLYAFAEEVSGRKIKTAGKKLSFRDGSIINYNGKTILTWLGNKGVDVAGSDIKDLSRNAADYSIPTAIEVRRFVKAFFFDDPRAYSRTMKWIGKTYYNANRSR